MHTHSRYATAFAAARQDISFVCNENAGALADRILVTKPYAAPGSTEWAEAAIESFVRQPGSRAVLLANHGVVAIGTPSKMRVWWPPKSSGPPRSLAWLACLAGGSS